MKTVFVKTNLQYAEKFCTATSITEDEQGKRSVCKRAIYPQGLAHIRDMERSCAELPAVLDKLTICPCRMEGERAVFAYNEGRSFYEYIVRQSKISEGRGIRAWKRFLSLLEPARGMEVPFQDSERFEELFGDGSVFEGERAYPVCAFDLTPSNVLMQGDGSSLLIDYEWRVSGPVPIALVKYHAITTAYYTYAEMSAVSPPVEKILSLAELKAPREAYQRALEHFYGVISGASGTVPGYSKIKRRYLKEKRGGYWQIS